MDPGLIPVPGCIPTVLSSSTQDSSSKEMGPYSILARYNIVM